MLTNIYAVRNQISGHSHPFIASYTRPDCPELQKHLRSITQILFKYRESTKSLLSKPATKSMPFLPLASKIKIVSMATLYRSPTVEW